MLRTSYWIWIVVPVVCGAILGVATLIVEDTDGRLELAVTVMGLILGAQLELIRRIERRQERHDIAGRIISQVEKLPEKMATAVRDNVKLMASVVEATWNDELYLKTLNARLSSQYSWLSQLKNGVIEVESDDTVLLIAWTKAAKRSIRGTMIAHTDVHWWNSPPGRQYWQVNLEAITHGVYVQRVFIYEKMTQDLSDLITRQAAAGVEAYVVQINNLRPELRLDLTIIDDLRVHDVLFSAGGNAMTYRYSKNPNQVAQMATKLERVTQAASQWPSSTVNHGYSAELGDLMSE